MNLYFRPQRVLYPVAPYEQCVPKAFQLRTHPHDQTQLTWHDGESLKPS